MSVCGGSLFGPSSQYIKLNGGDFIAVEGSNTRERLITSDLRMPYKQLLKSRVILKPGQVNYLLNHLGLGDNATFVAIKALYDPKSVIEDDNYIQWNFYTDFSKIYSMAQLLVLTGNSTHRVQQIYLTNPNPNYSVYLDVMCAVIDDNYSFFQDVVNQGGLSFNGLRYGDILTHIVDESIVLMSNELVPSPMAYITLSNINSIEKLGRILIIDDSSIGRIFLEFISEFDSIQAQSLLSWVLEAPGRIIQDLSPVVDLISPVIYFTPIVGLTGSTYSSPYNTLMGNTFSAIVSFGTYSNISIYGTQSSSLYSQIVNYISDNRDGVILLSNNNIIVKDILSFTISSITASGTYSMTFDFSDIAQNYVSDKKVIITVIP
jgi:hypothetical protein